MSPATARSGPISEAERISSIDVLRGLAVLGILTINIQVFAMCGYTFRNPIACGPLQGIEYWLWLLAYTLCAGKFATIFAMLFGAGIVLMADRRRASDLAPASTHYRRMVTLLVIALCHAYLWWYGDILYAYAIAGMLVYLLRGLRPWILIGLGASILTGAMLWEIRAGYALLDLHWWVLAQHNLGWFPSPELIAQEADTWNGGWLGQFELRRKIAFMIHTARFVERGLWLPSALMLIGMAMFKLRVFHAERSKTFYLGMIAAALLIGVPLSLYGIHRNEEAGWALEYSRYFGSQFHFAGIVPSACGWIGLIMLLCKSDRLRALSTRLAAVGRMALTNYLMHTVICTLIFRGHGLGLFGQCSRLELFGILLGIWLFQLWLSPLWLARFRLGPMEYLWRAVTYMELPRMRC
jgi:uncharacterized protein